ncbi:ubiquitin thioesterase OTUB1 [Phalacrocorax carbo]
MSQNNYKWVLQVGNPGCEAVAELNPPHRGERRHSPRDPGTAVTATERRRSGALPAASGDPEVLYGAGLRRTMAAEEPQQKPEPLGGDADGVNCLAYDEAIMAQQDRIQQEIAVQNPLVSERLELAVLYKEYAEDDHIYQQKIKDLLQKYSYIRKTRPDGNCFYRAFGFAHLEALLEDGQELQRFKEVSARSKEELVAQGFTEFTIEDFHNTFMELIERVERRVPLPELLAAFNEPSTSDYLVVYLRLLTSGCLQRHRRFFEQFLEGGRSIKEFCQQEVEPMCKESDHIHIIALARALHVSILVEYMDRGEGGATNPHVFPEGSQPRVCLLYRPGHYDILYK